jgi:16S rRNA (guanine1207-N2)-methyltransferase
MSGHIEQLLIELLTPAPEHPTGNALWIADESLTDTQFNAVRPHPALFVLSNRIEIGTALRRSGHQSSVSDFDFTSMPQTGFARIVYRVSKERPVVNHCINESFKALAPGGTLHLLGHKEDGIRTHGRSAERVFGTPEHAKKHGNAYRITLQKSLHAPETEPHWLDSKEYSLLRPCTVGELHFISKPGLFGWHKVDQGSALLVEQTRRLLAGRKKAGSVLDLGCGYGYLLLATADLPFSTRAATDNNAAAVLAATASFAKHNLPVSVTLDDCGEHLETTYDLILCNPPFHRGFSTSSTLAEKFLGQIRRLLSSDGQALVVVNEFIALEKLAANHFKRVVTLHHAHGFKVIQLS